MTMGSTVPDWLTPLAWTYLVLASLSTAVLAFDIYALRHRHHGAASEWVWIASGLYLGPIALLVYLRHGRATQRGMHGKSKPSQEGISAALATLPGGGASAVAHLIGVPVVAGIGWTIAGMEMWPMILVIAVLATFFLTAYEHAVARRPGAAQGGQISMGAALSVALLTVAAFDVGMVGWMVILHLNDLMPGAGDPTFWFLMQVGVVLGLVTGYPMVRSLLNRRTSVTIS